MAPTLAPAPILTGSFDPIGNPILKIALAGMLSDPTEFEAIIDTGFTGFVCMPLFKAFPLGLPLVGTTSVTLADGKQQTKLMAHTKAKVATKTAFGLVILEPTSNDLLIGMDFLRTFELALSVTKNGVALFEDIQEESKATAAAGA